MARTQELLQMAFGRDLASLIGLYFAAKSTHASDLGKAGHFEACDALDDHTSMDGIIGACRHGYTDLVIRMHSKFSDISGRIIEAAYRGGYPDVITAVCARSQCNDHTRYNRMLWGACRGGHLELARDAIHKGANSFAIGLTEAKDGGHSHLIDLILGKLGSHI